MAYMLMVGAAMAAWGGLKLRMAKIMEGWVYIGVGGICAFLGVLVELDVIQE